ncbi:unnamed protein product [Parajaminaea phylloscopi]
MTASSSPTPPSKRRRQNVRQACEECRRSKRKCDGVQPCGPCQASDKLCQFQVQASSSSSSVAGIGSSTPGALPAAPAVTYQQIRRHLVEPGSGRISFHQLAKRADPSGTQCHTAAAPKAWNLGLRDVVVYSGPRAPTASWHDLVPLADAHRYASRFLDEVNPVFSLVDPARVRSALAAMAPCSVALSIVATLCIAVGALFSAGDTYAQLEEPLLAIARGHLDDDAVVFAALESDQQDAIDYVSAKCLQALYLRAAGTPAAAWLASCTAMHWADIVGLHDEDKWQYRAGETHTLRRLFWSLQTLNSWMSLEYGRSRVRPAYIHVEAPASIDGAQPAALYELFTGTQDALFLEVTHDTAPSLVETLKSLAALELHGTAAKTLSIDRAYAAFIIYRRLRTFDFTSVGKDVERLVIAMAKDGLSGCREMTQRVCPWWHTANLPFQALCTFLVMDSDEAHAQVAYAYETLSFVGATFHTAEVVQTMRTCKSLVRLFREQKERDMARLGAALDRIETAEAMQMATATATTTSAAPVNGSGSGSGASHGATPVSAIAGAGLGSSGAAWDAMHILDLLGEGPTAHPLWP